MELVEAKNISLELMESSKAAYLTTIDSVGYPITRAMFNLRNKEQFPELSEFFTNQDNKFVIYISTKSSSKIEQIKKNPKVAIYYCEPEEFKGVMFGGDAEIIDDIELKKKIWLEWWTKYYSEGVEDPDYSLLKLNPINARFYYRLNKVQFLPRGK
jgi:general stress protein 26